MNRFISAALKKWRPIANVLSVSATVVVLGCGDDNSGLASRYKVMGKVTYKGVLVANGNIHFEPTKPPVPAGRHASGAIKDGYYSLSTAGDGEDGALPGEYKVFIVATDIDMAAFAAKTGGQRHQGDREDQKAGNTQRGEHRSHVFLLAACDTTTPRLRRGSRNVVRLRGQDFALMADSQRYRRR